MAQKIVLAYYLEKKHKSLIRYVPDYFGRNAKYVNIYALMWDYNVPMHVAKISVSKRYKELRRTSVLNEILIFLILNFIPFL